MIITIALAQLLYIYVADSPPRRFIFAPSLVSPLHFLINITQNNIWISRLLFFSYYTIFFLPPSLLSRAMLIYPITRVFIYSHITADYIYILPREREVYYVNAGALSRVRLLIIRLGGGLFASGFCSSAHPRQTCPRGASLANVHPFSLRLVNACEYIRI